MDTQQCYKVFGRQNGRNRVREIICYSCNEPGHISTICPKAKLQTKNLIEHKNGTDHLRSGQGGYVTGGIRSIVRQLDSPTVS